MVALLFCLAGWSDRHIDRHTETCTDVKCSWDIARKESVPMKLNDIEHSLTSRVQPFENIFNPVCENNVQDAEIEMSLLNLVKGHETQIIEVLDSSDETESLPKSITEFAQDFLDNSCFLDHLRSEITQKDCDMIYSLTEGQDNQMWYDYRLGRITSSIIPLVYHYQGNDENNYILKLILDKNYSFSTLAMEYGKEREHLARNLYSTDCASKHDDVKIELSGLIINKELPHLGASPDAIVQCRCCGKGLVEIKSPYKYKNQTIEDITNDKRYHLIKDDQGEFKLKRTSNWYFQIQSQMAISNLQWCDFVLYLEGNVKTGKHKIHVERITFDQELWREVLKKVNIFYKQFVIPKLFQMQ